MPALWEVSERQAPQYPAPAEKLYAATNFAVDLSQAGGFQQVDAVEVPTADSCSAPGNSTAHKAEAKRQDESYASIEIQHEIPAGTRRDSLSLVVAVVATAEVLAGLGLLWKYLQPQSATPQLDAMDSLALTAVSSDAAHGPPSSLLSEDTESGTSSVEDGDSLRTAMRHLTAENQALKKTIHSVWRGDAIDIWDFEDQVPAASDHSSKSSTKSASSTFDDGHSLSRRSSSIPETFSIGSRESSFAIIRQGSSRPTTREGSSCSDSDVASSQYPVSSDDEASSSHHALFSDDDAASLDHPVSSNGNAASSHQHALSDDDAASSQDPPSPLVAERIAPISDDEDLDGQHLQNICFHSGPAGIQLYRFEAEPRTSVAELILNLEPRTPNPEHQHALIDNDDGDAASSQDPPCPLVAERIASISDDEDLGGQHLRNICFSKPRGLAGTGEVVARFSAPYTPSVSSDESEASNPVNRHRVNTVEPLQSPARIKVIGSCTKKHCFSSPYASSVSCTSEASDEERQVDSDDEKSFPQHDRQVASIPEASEAEDDDFVRDSWRLVDGKLMQRSRSGSMASHDKVQPENRDLLSMMLSLW